MKSLKTHFALIVVLFVGIGIYLSPLHPSFLCLQFTFNEQSFNNILSEWQRDGVTHYRAHFPADFLLLVSYALFGYRFGIARAAVLSKQLWLRGFLIWSLPVAAMADALENILHLALTGGTVSSSTSVYLLSGIAACIKFVFIGFFFLCLLLAWKKQKR